jgi:SAM-dependent methyltransferase
MASPDPHPSAGGREPGATRPSPGAGLGRAGFESGSETYERARPDYPAAAVDRIFATTGSARGTRVLDVAAGTGKLTRQLSARGANCVALEPSAAMRQVFERVLPGVALIAGTAEYIPAASGSMESVVVAQAFHWFDAARALPEIARVLRPGGSLSLIWNERDESDPTMAELVRVSKWDRNQPYPMGKDFGEFVDRSRLFGPVERTQFSFVQPVDRRQFVEQVATRSYVRVMDELDQQALLVQVAELAAALDEPIAMPYITDLFCARALGA